MIKLPKMKPRQEFINKKQYIHYEISKKTKTRKMSNLKKYTNNWHEKKCYCVAYMIRERARALTRSPSRGISPEPKRTSNTFTPPEFGSSRNSDIVDLEEEEEAGGEKISVEKVAEKRERDRAALLLVTEEDEDVAETLFEGDIGGTNRRIGWWETRGDCTAAEH